MGYGFRLRFVGYVWGFEANIRAECFGASIVRCMIGRSIFRLGFFGCRLGMIRSRFLVLILDYLEVYWFCIRVYFLFRPGFLPGAQHDLLVALPDPHIGLGWVWGSRP